MRLSISFINLVSCPRSLTASFRSLFFSSMHCASIVMCRSSFSGTFLKRIFSSVSLFRSIYRPSHPLETLPPSRTLRLFHFANYKLMHIVSFLYYFMFLLHFRLHWRKTDPSLLLVASSNSSPCLCEKKTSISFWIPSYFPKFKMFPWGALQPYSFEQSAS